MVLPVANDVLGIATKMLGYDRVMVSVRTVMNASAEFEER